MSTHSISSVGSQNEDWDSLLVLSESRSSGCSTSATAPRNTIAFPVHDSATAGKPTGDAGGRIGNPGKRSMSELMRLHAEKGTNGEFSQEEASRVADVLGQWVRGFQFCPFWWLCSICRLNCTSFWARLTLVFCQINASSSPYEGEDDFFSRSQDDLSMLSKRTPAPAVETRLRGQSESTSLRHLGSMEFVKS